MDFPNFIEYEDFVALADQFLKRYYPECKIPIPIDQIAEFRLNIHLVPIDGLLDLYGMDAFINRDQSEIAIDRRVFDYGGTRYRFSIAHEIAHVLLKHDKYFQQVKTIAEWVTHMRDLPSDIYGRLEYQANCVASCILVPRDGLKERFEAIKKQFMSKNVSHLESQDITERILAREYAVNDLTMHVRLEKERLLKYPWDL